MGEGRKGKQLPMCTYTLHHFKSSSLLAAIQNLVNSILRHVLFLPAAALQILFRSSYLEYPKLGVSYIQIHKYLKRPFNRGLFLYCIWQISNRVVWKLPKLVDVLVHSNTEESLLLTKPTFWSSKVGLHLTWNKWRLAIFSEALTKDIDFGDQ